MGIQLKTADYYGSSASFLNFKLIFGSFYLCFVGDKKNKVGLAWLIIYT